MSKVFRALWGYLSDKKGRRPVLIVSVVGSIVSTLILGLSPNYYVALTSRAIGGITDCRFKQKTWISNFTATFGVGLAYISDITDASNKARGFSIIALGWGVGSILGPAIGGFFSQPAEKYKRIFSSTGKNLLFANVSPKGIFARFPYLLPCIITSIVLTFSLILILAFLKESLHQAVSYSTLESESTSQPIYTTQEDVQLEDLTEVNLENVISGNTFLRHSSYNVEEVPKKQPLRSKIWHWFKENKSATVTLVVYWIISFLYVAIDEVVPLWALTEVSKGGSHFSCSFDAQRVEFWDQ